MRKSQPSCQVLALVFPNTCTTWPWTVSFAVCFEQLSLSLDPFPTCFCWMCTMLLRLSAFNSSWDIFWCDHQTSCQFTQALLISYSSPACSNIMLSGVIKIPKHIENVLMLWIYSSQAVDKSFPFMCKYITMDMYHAYSVKICQG